MRNNRNKQLFEPETLLVGGRRQEESQAPAPPPGFLLRKSRSGKEENIPNIRNI
jgi:hypothetical protein